ncbi:hypothetical protein HOO65_050496 [Ceratocystis lukuohia]|uniref:HNH nuclease domain-containing protein n=1 Tax=Ceratocystis lukuohia TaxID=2019550 RepID=A0ABR4MGJ5_9PEZI
MQIIQDLSAAFNKAQQLPQFQKKLAITTIMLVISLLQTQDGEHNVSFFAAAMKKKNDTMKTGVPRFIDHLSEREDLLRNWMEMRLGNTYAEAIAMTADWNTIHQLPTDEVHQRFYNTFNMCRMWFCKPPICSMQSVLTSSTPQPRSTRPGYQRTADLLTTSHHQARHRDSQTCIVSMLRGPTEVCHIVPSSINGEKLTIFKEFVGGFCPNLLPRVQELFPAKNTDIVENLMCLTPTLQSFWGAGLFALEPVSTSSTSTTVRFWWMNDLLRQINTRLPRPVLCRPHFFYSPSGLPILTGDIMEFRSMPEIPAPDYTLLKVQYLMQIMGVICGAAEPDEDQDGDDEADVDAL